jgi:hypothetical protein
MLAEMRTGETLAADGTVNPGRSGKTGALIVQDAHGRFAEATRRGRLFSTGMGLTSINNATFTTATLGATATPVVGVWNPGTSTVNLEVLLAALVLAVTAGTATGPGGFSWLYSIGNNAITTGLNPVNRRTLGATGALGKGFAGTALTGLTTNLVVAGASALMGGNLKNISSVETAVGQNIGYGGVTQEILDGSWLVPPGGVLALLCHTTPVAHSAASMLVWEEVPIVSPG